ncbi:MAG TPA: serpin family protein [Polyangiaceae bacterium]
MFLGFVPLLGACSGPSGGGFATPGSADVASSTLARDPAPDVSPADQAALEAGNASFAFDLFGALRRPSDNVFFSPYSITSALAMTYAGARGGTADELANALHLTLPPERLHPAFDWLDLQLAARAGAAVSDAGKPFALHVASSLWGQRGEAWKQPFLDTLAVDYGAAIELADFEHDPRGALGAINAWASGQTAGKIANLLPSGAVDADTRFVLANAIYFDASWAHPFQATATSQATFTRGDASTEEVATMHAVDRFLYAEGEGWQAVELPYDGDQVAMDVVLPAAASEAAFDAGLTASGFASVVAGLGLAKVHLALPKFAVSGGSVSVRAALEQLGVRSAFAAGADLGGMCDDAMFLKDAVHQATLTVDENGTEAAAATGGVTSTVTPQREATVTVDHPFFFVIRDLPTGTVLFAGKIVEPNG